MFSDRKFKQSLDRWLTIPPIESAHPLCQSCTRKRCPNPCKELIDLIKNDIIYEVGINIKELEQEYYDEFGEQEDEF